MGIPPTLRTRMELAVQRLLDALDGDPDLEAACEDEGHDSDTETDYADMG